ncbi:MAG: hypothetical protein BYD32DRAFT_422877 [Podila humilis]|nr:MAG: hypothetical protein BYD32DRAFT_422877 [Podila humilis]
MQGFPQRQATTSPQKRLNPHSVITRPKRPPALAPNPSSHVPNHTQRGLATTPTKVSSALSRSLRLGSSCNNPMQHIRPPKPLESKLQKLAKTKAKAKAKAKEEETMDEIESTLSDMPVAVGRTASVIWQGNRKRALSPQPSDLVPVGSRLSTRQLSPPPMINTIPLPTRILEFFKKVTPIKQYTLETGLHAFALVMSIGPPTKTRNGYLIVEMTAWDPTDISFQVVLWEKKCEWAKQIKTSDVILITDLKKGKFQNSVNWSTTFNSRMERLDGSMLTQYHGSPAIEANLKIFIEKRRIAGFDLLDSGIAQEQSFYVTQALVSAAPMMYPRHVPKMAALESASSSTTTNSEPTDAPISIVACVLYLLLVEPRGVSMDWEIGAVRADGQMIKIMSIGDAPIRELAPGRAFKFSGKFCPTDNGEYIFQIAASRMPLNISGPWLTSGSRAEPKGFASLKALKCHRFQGDAVIEAHLLGVYFDTVLSISDPKFQLLDNMGVYFLDPGLQPTGTIDQGSQSLHNMRGFIQRYCLCCMSLAATSPMEPSSFFCPNCDLDPTKRARQFQWVYPRFEITLGDHPRVSHNLSSEQIQVRCDRALGDQLFPSLPASQWMQDANSFVRSKSRWKRLSKLMLGGQDSSGDDVFSEVTNPPRVKVHLTVGLNEIFKATKLEYIWS